MIDDPHPLGAGIRLRPTVPADAASLAASLTRSRTYMRPWEPERPDSFYTEQGQRERLAALLADREAGRVMPWVLADAEDRVVGGFNLNAIVLGPLRSAVLGYWVDVELAGRGLATAAVRTICDLARSELRLHRIEAGTVLHNAASQRVLAKCGFEEYGVAPRYLHIDGEWRDHRLFQRILHDGPVTGAED
ncbi:MULTISPECIES: GNAT family protein [unclassified Streptomyces]|uniref:GNAT family N-acetyltransferase n=1 Tax=unclassified Streptomyces TaxID=2593676 RepID=UPI002ED1DD06|nr:GNAT family N-acetyltransferase [Streptomyces sp. NBC_00891]WSY05725.1 GNAT family N-acetyltransferase [Streptomyces sp. NBC_00890]WSZ07349.1 GNAT family N-acetyltransferase [Streptomyces sp. NBC_00869]WSZ25152.1 GNAT family N-acetyltransferase [Streptomyces sp. NBC_00870]